MNALHFGVNDVAYHSARFILHKAIKRGARKMIFGVDVVFGEEPIGRAAMRKIYKKRRF